MTSLAMSDAANWIGILSYGLVALLGLWLIARKVFGWGHSHAHAPKPAKGLDLTALAHQRLHAGEGREHALQQTGGFRFESPGTKPGGPDAHGRMPGDAHYGHDHGSDDHHDHVHVVTPDKAIGTWREQLGVVFAVGLRPCSGALVVLVFALSQGLLAAGIAAVFLMGLGTAITTGVLATLAVSAKGLTRRVLGRESAAAGAIVWWAELLGACAVFGFGVILLLASI